MRTSEESYDIQYPSQKIDLANRRQLISSESSASNSKLARARQSAICRLAMAGVGASSLTICEQLPALNVQLPARNQRLLLAYSHRSRRTREGQQPLAFDAFEFGCTKSPLSLTNQSGLEPGRMQVGGLQPIPIDSDPVLRNYGSFLFNCDPDHSGPSHKWCECSH